MTKRIFNISFLLLLLALSCLFFPVLNERIEVAQAVAIEGVSGNKIVLTGIAGYSPKHFFLDENQQSTLVNAKTKTEDGEYYYSIVDSSGKSSSGWGEFCPTTDIMALVKKGLVYVKATANVSSKYTETKITISAGGVSESASGVNGDISTQLLKLTENTQNIRFTFETSGKRNDFVMREPTIYIYTVIESVTLDCEDRVVSPGQLVKINAYNDVTQITGIAGNFVNFSKLNHAIEYEFVEGGDLVEVSGSNFAISPNAPDDATIKFRAYANRNSYSTEKIFSENYVTFTVSRENVNVTVSTDFSDKEFTDAVKFIGEGQYGPGKRVTLRVEYGGNFEFLGWYINGEKQNEQTKLITSAEFGKDIYAKFRKTISVDEISIAERIYDGTTNIENDMVQITLNGVEVGHDVAATGLEYEYSDPNVAQRVLARLKNNNSQLIGKEKDIYALSDVLPDAYGSITKRPVKVTPQNTTKQYRYADSMQFSVADLADDGKPLNLANGETALSGELGREAGEELGRYLINLGSLPEENKNYEVLLEENSYFEIVPRVLNLENINVGEKVYDGTTTVPSIEASLGNVYGDEQVYAVVEGQFVSPNAGNVEVKITKSELRGADSKNYVLAQHDEPIFGTINTRPTTITATACTRTYGDDSPFEYVADGLLEGDTFSGSLSISNGNVGEHMIELGTLKNPNYTIAGFTPATCTITPRELIVKAKKRTKTYGDDDPIFTYTLENLVNSDTLSGELAREHGENVGEYKITLGTLSNSNYVITFIENVLQITKRKIVVEVTFKNKEYDGTTLVDWDVKYQNNITETPFILNLDAKLNSKNCGTATLNIEDHEIECEGKDNFDFLFEFTNSSIQISKRNVRILVNESSKSYGDVDPNFTYTGLNMIDGDTLQLEISRAEGQNVGQYEFSITETAPNLNYNISLTTTYFEILPRKMRISVDNITKMFGDKDPEIHFDVIDDFCFDDKDVIDGEISRQDGESVGVYSFDLSGLCSNKNYYFVNANDTHFIILKRPVVVTCFEATKVYGDDDPKFNYTVSNDIEGERLSVEISRQFGEDVGEYQLLCTNNDARYVITFVSANLVITPSSISVKADAKTKIYGDDDPYFTVSVTNGLLKNNDRIENISTGNMVREQGENVGTYKINLGDFSFGKNYILTFEGDNLTIIKRHVIISAAHTNKTYGDDDPLLECQISGDGLAFSDKIEGHLVRDEGEDVGTYTIHRGDLNLNSNYELTFYEGTFEILPRKIEIVPINAFKHYGDEEKEIEYQIVGSMVEGDTLEGKLFRDKGKDERESVGRYRIHSTLKNTNYEIVFNECYFNILPRKIFVEAQSFEINYGDDDPELSYKIVDGTILDGDVIQGGLYRVQGNSVGVYDIISTLTLGRNYDIHFKKGTVTILPLHLTIQSENYEKIYGQEDPTFTYKIIEGELINGDSLYGTITREKGEDVGTYNLVNSVYNGNYEIDLLSAKLEILKKDVYLIVSVSDKIYDGTTSAFIKNAYVSGIAKDVYLNYDRKTCAVFESPEIGKNIAIHLNNITLDGEKAKNYNLIYPTNVVANITLGHIENDDVGVSTNDPVLEQGFSLKYESNSVEKPVKIGKYRSSYVIYIWMEKNGEQVNPDGLFTINMNVPDEIFAKNNIYVYRKTENGYARVSCQKVENGKLEVMSDGLGEFYIVIDSETWLNYGAYLSLFVIALVLVCVTIIVIKNKKKRKIRL